MPSEAHLPHSSADLEPVSKLKQVQGQQPQSESTPPTFTNMIRGGDTPLWSLHKHVELRKSPLGGYGLFTTAKICAGEVVWADDLERTMDDSVPISEVETWPTERRQDFLHYAYQVSPTHMEGCDDKTRALNDAARFHNHSCDPNTWFVGDTTMTAVRDIEAGEEITYDYATSETYFEKFDKCLCGTKLCRGKVRKDDWKDPELRRRYGRHWMQYILDMMDAEENASVGA